jgi:integrase
MSRWQRVRDQPDFIGKPDSRRPPDWLYSRTGKRGRTSFRVDYRRDGIELQKKVPGAEDWKEATRLGERMIFETKHGTKPTSPALVRCADLARQIIDSKRTLAPATFEQTETFFRLHLLPFLETHCPYARDLKPEVWEHYKREKRREHPEVALFNHWKFMSMLRRRAHKQGLIAEFTFDFDEKSEDSRREGLVISFDDFAKMLAAASPEWRDRLILGRRTGMRPGEPRCLKVDRVDFDRKTISLKGKDTKTREARTFIVESEDVWVILRRRAKVSIDSGSPYFFPSESNPSKPVGRSNRGWKALLRRARVNPEYVPNDLRHTFITEMIRAGVPLSDIADYVGNSVEEIERTYKHMRVEDTRRVAEAASRSLGREEHASPLRRSYKPNDSVITATSDTSAA